MVNNLTPCHIWGKEKMDLSLIQTRDLIQELDKRFDASIFASWKNLGKTDDYDWHINGNKLMCGQLARFVSKKVDNDMVAEETDGFGIEN